MEGSTCYPEPTLARAPGCGWPDDADRGEQHRMRGTNADGSTVPLNTAL